MTTVLIIDDHPIVLQGCRRMLEDAGFTDVIEAADAASGYQLFNDKRPQVVIIDLGLQDNRLSGLELIRRIRADDTKARILVFSMHSDPVIIARALQAGATGYVVKDTSAEHFIEAFKKVRAGTPYRFASGICEHTGRAGSARRPYPSRTADLVVARRRQVLQPNRRRPQRKL